MNWKSNVFFRRFTQETRPFWVNNSSCISNAREKR